MSSSPDAAVIHKSHINQHNGYSQEGHMSPVGHRLLSANSERGEAGSVHLHKGDACS